jgi:hypothetical protein
MVCPGTLFIGDNGAFLCIPMKIGVKFEHCFKLPGRAFCPGRVCQCISVHISTLILSAYLHRTCAKVHTIMTVLEHVQVSIRA